MSRDQQRLNIEQFRVHEHKDTPKIGDLNNYLYNCLIYVCTLIKVDQGLIKLFIKVYLNLNLN